MTDNNRKSNLKTVNIDKEIHKQAKQIALNTDLTIAEVIELLISNHSEEEIKKLAKKQGK